MLRALSVVRVITYLVIEINKLGITYLVVIFLQMLKTDAGSR